MRGKTFNFLFMKKIIFFLASLLGLFTINSCDKTQNNPDLVIKANIPDSVCQNVAAIFRDSTQNAKTWTWNFGDGISVSTQNATHTYTTTGNFEVKLTVSDGTTTKTTTKNLHIKNCGAQSNTHRLIFKIKLDSTQVRLNNFGQPSTIPAGHAAQSPKFNQIAAHYIELAPTMFTQLGSGNVLYVGKETTQGGSKAIIFDSLKKIGNNEECFSVPLSQVQAGNYQYLRVSVAYQNYDIKFKYTYSGFPPFYFTGTIASFVGFNTYIKDYTIKTQSVSVNANKSQGYWGFELPATPPYIPSAQTSFGNAPATTVVNPIASTSPIPAGSCVVTAPFTSPLNITGLEDHDIIVTISLSVNKSFEWIDNTADGYFEPAIGEMVTDMGIRGMIPIVQ